MWNLVYTTKFKKNIKRYKNQATKIAALRTVLNQLQEKGTVDASFKPHLLSG